MTRQQALSLLAIGFSSLLSIPSHAWVRCSVLGGSVSCTSHASQKSKSGCLSYARNEARMNCIQIAHKGCTINYENTEPFYDGLNYDPPRQTAWSCSVIAQSQ